ncbi:MAG: cytochrome b [Pseudomonadota bacterium]
MGLRNTPNRYGGLAMTFHWLLAAAVIFMLWLGIAMERMGMEGRLLGMDQFAAYQLHKSIGFTILILALLRLIWRWMNPVPPLPDNLKTWERWAAALTHVALYLLLIAMPIIGWVMVSASPWQIPTYLYGAIELPHLTGPSEELERAMKRLHATLGFAFIALLVLHIAAALKHHFVMKDDTLKRMLPGSRI